MKSLNIERRLRENLNLSLSNAKMKKKVEIYPQNLCILHDGKGVIGTCIS